MDTVLLTRVRAAGAEMNKPGHWRVALNQLDQAVSQLLAAPSLDQATAQVTLENLYALYQWSAVMQGHELTRLNTAVMRLCTAITD